MKKYTGKSLDELLKQIANEKNTTIEEITYQILEEKLGFLGVGKEVTISAYTKKDIKDFIYDYLMNYFDEIGMDVAIEIEEAEENFFKIVLNASNNAILIGKNGQTLQAINTVLKAATSGTFKKRISLLVDVNGYKNDKYRKECALATRVAKTVQRTKTDAILDPMPNDERKAIHNHLANWEHIQTVSEGEGNQRRLKICYVENK
ncbi:MAG: KH domain-containing protein [Erysipelotrichia bacterium]|nr:KH domain-containing protein [Erysipelotrichia bacterium]